MYFISVVIQFTFSGGQVFENVITDDHPLVWLERQLKADHAAMSASKTRILFWKFLGNDFNDLIDAPGSELKRQIRERK